MCSCADAESPSVMNTTYRRARKEHRCRECRKMISIGARYEYISGVWSGHGESFKTCLRCVRLRSAHVEGEAAGGERCYPVFGDLLSAIRECVVGNRAYLTAFRESYRSST